MADTPQFGTAEYQAQEDGDSCRTCGQRIMSQYFQINGAMTCPACAATTRASLPKDTHGGFTRGVLFGIAGAILGLILYSVVGIVTGLEIGYVSLAVGYIVGRAFLFGTSGIGGRRHQIAAALLTYAAVSMSAVPIGLYHFMNEPDSSSAAVVSPETTTIEAEPAASTQVADEAPPSLSSVVLFLAVVGLISPFLGMSNPVSGLIGLVILFVGIRIAWSMTEGKPVQITGPFTV